MSPSSAGTLKIPEFAVVGHPNEGKSSVVSTLTEDDQIRVSPIPGETTRSVSYTVRLDGSDIIRFVDTPGFQVPRQTLAWFRKHAGDPESLVPDFIEALGTDPFYADDCELLRPVARGAGIIYVVDGARPVRDDDLAEMEILRLTGRPRMAVINAKTHERDHTREWKQEFRRHFNSVRIFNSNTATFAERIRMLESLKAIDQEWEEALSGVISAFQADWRKRNRMTAAAIVRTLEESLALALFEPAGPKADLPILRERLRNRYQERIKAMETRMFQTIRSLFRHRLYEYHLPEYSVLKHDLFSKQTWDLLGLTREQLAAAGAVIGGTMGAAVDIAAHGLTFGVFTALGGLLGAGSAIAGGRKMARKGVPGIRLGGDRLQLGPSRDLQLLYILLDRVLLYYSHIINRPHGRRDPSGQPAGPEPVKQGFAASLSPERRKACNDFFRAVTGPALIRSRKALPAFEHMLETLLNEISGD